MRISQPPLSVNYVHTSHRVQNIFSRLLRLISQDVESEKDFHQPHPYRDTLSIRGVTPPPPATGTTNGTNARKYRTSAAAAERGSRPSRASGVSSGGERGRSGGGGVRRSGASTTDMVDNDLGRTLRHNNNCTSTERNVSHLLTATGGKLRAADVSGAEEGSGTGGVGVPWRSEVGAGGRVKRYMERRGERLARQTRLDNVTRNLLNAL